MEFPTTLKINYIRMKHLIFTLLFICSLNGAFANFISQRNWRWRNNDGTETSATWKAAENNSITISDLNPLRLRLELDNNTSDSINFDKALEFTTNPSIGPWKRVGVVGTNEFMLVGKNEFLTDGLATTRQLTGSSSNPFVSGRMMVNSEENYHFLKTKTKTEYEWVLKPTDRVEKNTTYYFRTAVGDYPVTLPSLTTSSDIPCKERWVTNGSFESDLSGWSNISSDGGSATFGINTVDTLVHSGYQSLVASVKTLGSKSSSIQTSKVFTTSGDSIHLLQFWARSKVDKADLMVAIIDGTDTLKCQFKIRSGWYSDATTPSNSHGGWYQYHFPFKLKSSSATLKFYYQTVSDYYIDDVEMMDQSDGIIDVYTTYMWHYNRNGYGWYNADNDISVGLPDGRVAWFFNDSFLGTNNPFNNYCMGDKFVRNSMVVQDKDNQLTTRYSAAGGNKNTYFIPIAAAPTSGYTNLYWLADGIIEAGKLKQMLIEVEYDPSSSSDTRATGRTYMATFSLPALELENIVQMPSGYDYENILDDGEYYYLYGAESSGLTGYTKIARAKKGDIIGANTPWQFYNTKTGWYPIKDSASRVCPYWVNSVKKLGTGNYAMVISDAMSSQEKLTFAPTPLGPWAKSILLYQVPTEINYWNYMPNIHNDLYSPGKYTISYSVNGYEPWGPSFNDKYFYWPRYIQADLLKLSPYTGQSNKSLITGKNYQLIARHSGKVLQVNTDGATIEQSSFINGANQLWVITDVGEGYYKITDYASGKALGVNKSSMNDGTVLQLSAFANDYNQLWAIDTLNNQYFKMINRNSGKALEIAGSDISDGAKADQWQYQEQTNQQWKIAVNTTLPTSVKELTTKRSDSIVLYPNPASGTLYIEGLPQNSELTIYNLQGKEIKKEWGTSINVAPLASGSYFLKIKKGSEILLKMFIKE